MRIEKEKITITKEIMRIDTRRQTIDMRQINNRRFLYNPKTAVLVLGRQYGKTKGLPASHAEELAGAGITKDFDDFVRGWIGTSRSYPEGIIHFAPCVDERNIKLFERAFDTLEMFRENGRSGRDGDTGIGEPLGAALICHFHRFAEAGTENLCQGAAKETVGGKSCPA